VFLLLIRDQEVDGSNPFAPTNFFNDLHVISGFPSAPLVLRKNLIGTTPPFFQGGNHDAVRQKNPERFTMPRRL
jgi:hypothetical protein